MESQQLISYQKLARHHYVEAHKFARQSIEEVWKCGEALEKVKAGLAHGEWMPWMESVGINYRKAGRWMQIAGNYQIGQLVQFESTDEALKALKSRPAPDTESANIEDATIVEEQPLTAAERQLIKIDNLWLGDAERCVGLLRERLPA